MSPSVQARLQTPTIQRLEHNSDTTEISSEVSDSIRHAGGGKRLTAGLQRKMEHGFGTGFGGVRVHTDSHADKLNRSLNARAFTVGQDIFFRRGSFRPHTPTGKHLLAHELAHTVQQKSTAPVVQRFIYRGDSPLNLKKRMNPYDVRQLLERTYAVPSDIAERYVSTYGHVTKPPNIQLANLVKLARSEARSRKSPVKKSKPRKLKSSRKTKSSREVLAPRIELDDNLNSKDDPIIEVPEPKETSHKLDVPKRPKTPVKSKSESLLDIPEPEPKRPVKPGLPSREAVIKALETGEKLGSTSLNADKIFKIIVNGKPYVVKYEESHGGLRESLPPTIAKKYGLGDYYVDAVHYKAPDNPREMVVMPFVRAETGKNLTEYQKHKLDLDKHLEIVLFEWLIGSTDRHDGNVMFTDQKEQPWKLFDHGASLGVGARGNKTSSNPAKRLGAVNILFEAYIQEKLPELSPTQIKKSYGLFSQKIPPEYETLYIFKETVDKILNMGKDILAELENNKAPKSYSTFVESGITYLNKCLSEGGDKVSFAQLLTPTKTKKKAVKPSKKKKEKKSKPKRKPKKPKSVEKVIPVPVPKSPVPEKETKIAKKSTEAVENAYAFLKQNYIKKNHSYPFTSTGEVEQIKQKIGEKLTNNEKLVPSELVNDFEVWICQLDFIDGDDPGLVLFEKVAKKYHEQYGLKLDKVKGMATALLTELVLEGPHAGFEETLNPLDPDYAADVAYYLHETFSKYGLDIEPKSEKKKAVKRHRAMTIPRAKHVLKTKVKGIVADNWAGFAQWLKLKEIEIPGPKGEYPKLSKKQKLADLAEEQLIKLGLEYRQSCEDIIREHNLRKQKEREEELKKRKELADNKEPEAFANEITKLIKLDDQSVISKMADVLSLWPKERRLKFMKKLPKEYHSIALLAGFGPTGEYGLDYGKAIQFRGGQPLDMKDNTSRPMYKWLYEGAEEPSTMNCWEAVLFAGYRVGLLTKEQVRLLDTPDADTSTPEIVLRVQESHAGEIHGGSPQAFISNYNQKPPEIPIGHIVEWGGGRGGGSHVAVSMGNGNVIEHDATTGTGDAGVRISSLDAVTKNVAPKCTSPVHMYWAPYACLFGVTKNSVEERYEKYALEQRPFEVVTKGKLATPLSQGEAVFDEPPKYFYAKDTKTQDLVALKCGQENIEFRRFDRLGENPKAWHLMPIKADNTGASDPNKIPIYEVNDGHHRFVYQSTLGDSRVNLELRDNKASNTPDSWSSMIWLIETWGRKGMTLDESRTHFKKR